MSDYDHIWKALESWQQRVEKAEADLAEAQEQLRTQDVTMAVAIDKSNALEAERDRLREALEYVRDNTGEEGIFVAAREALEGKETGD